MGDVTDFARADRPSTAQPPPEHVPGGRSVHDMVVWDISRNDRRRGACRALTALLRKRKAFGLRKYGTVLQVDEPHRRAELDLLEELGDAVVYAKRAAELGVDGAAPIYEALLAITGNAASRWYAVAGKEQRGA